MSEKHHKSILLTNPDGFQSHLFEPSTSDTNDVTNIEHIVPADEPEPISSNDFDTSNGNNSSNKIGGVQFDSEQIERGRSRIMKRDIAVRNDSSGSRSNGIGSGSENRTSLSRSRSRSRSMSRSRSRIREEEFLKWTVLRQDPSMRLYNVKRKNIKKPHKKEEEEEDSEEEGEVNKEEEDEEEDEESDEEDDEESEESDEEQVSDIEDDAEIDSKFDYDPGMKVLPNFVVSINDVLESKKPWINKFKNNDEYLNIEKDIKLERMDEGYIRGLKLLSKKLPIETPVADTLNTQQQNEGNCYILYVDMTSESMYALTYVMGTIVNNGDTLYIVQWESSSVKVSDNTIKENIIKISENCYHLFDCISGVIDTLDIIILSLTHPYPKHLLNEMITTLKPRTLCCSLSMILSGLQNFVCGVPTLVIRKKLKRTKKKGIME
ncbi:hypothetical protein C6P45_004779 [Maudiozyma exigua]|uniref:Sugar utilization regulatory protein IMP2 n=1 Tax=Maudiozyma exigua TaxID=34358 RepID=A0A9P6WF45_MAUEX|nr:hypothetical protein C6P45_004779 [Kazachstania exigua]